MEKLTNRSSVIEMLGHLLAVEKAARERYLKESISFNNEKLKSTIASIKEDEDRHIKMIEGLISFLKTKAT